MTRIIDGFAQPDIVARKGSEERYIFVETPQSLRENAGALEKTMGWLRDNKPNATVDFVQTVPRK